MKLNKVLIFYISANSGHQSAAMAIEAAIGIIDKRGKRLAIDYLRYSNPIINKLVIKAYHSILKRTPEIWDYLYDNPRVKKKTTRLIDLAHKLNSAKIHRLIKWYKPDIIVCTQAFPCIAMADYKRRRKSNIPIVGIITDYGVHSYWADKDVDLYIVSTEKEKSRLIKLGIRKCRIDVLGIPVNPRFYEPLDKVELKWQFGMEKGKPIILIMGGSKGMISMEKIVNALIKLSLDFYLVVICGTNKSLHRKLAKIQKRTGFPMQVYGYVRDIEKFMSLSDIMITKPGGLTITEALIKRLPMIIVNPIPGQEAKNTEFLNRHNTAVQAKDAKDVAGYIKKFITNPAELSRFRERLFNLSKPHALFDIARRIIYWDN